MQSPNSGNVINVFAVLNRVGLILNLLLRSNKSGSGITEVLTQLLKEFN